MKPPPSAMSLLAAGWEGRRTATVSRPPVVSLGTRAALGRIMVRGPGQKASPSRLAASGTLSATRPMSAHLQIWTIRGLSEGLPLAA